MYNQPFFFYLPFLFMDVVFANPTFVLFAVLCLGMALGHISVKGVSLGNSGVLFIALAAGHFGLKVPEGIMGIGTALFVYCVGLGVGNRFFSSLGKKGSIFMLLSLLMASSAMLVTWGSCKLFGIGPEMAAGLFSGANTSTPALAAAVESVVENGGDSALVNIGYGVAYPFGVISVVLFVQLLPRLLKKDLNETPEGKADEKAPTDIIKRVVRVTNPEVLGWNITTYVESGALKCLIPRVVKEEVLMPLSAEDVFSLDQEVLMVGERASVEHDVGLLGHVSHSHHLLRSYGDESAELIVLNASLCGCPLRRLRTLENHGVSITRVTRLGHTFVPTADTELVRNDVVRVVGSATAVRDFSATCGHRSSALNVTDILSLTGGVALGILLGNVEISLGEGKGFSLGMAGGPLLVALILGHFGKLGPIAGYIPRPSRVLLMDFALMLFLAGAGVTGGEKLVQTVMEQGLVMLFIGALISTLPLALGYYVTRKLMRLPLAEALGAICGSVTSTPALGAITAKTERQEPVIAYATAYPAAMILMTVLVEVLMGLF